MNNMRLRRGVWVWGLGSKLNVQDLEFRVQGLGFNVWGLGDEGLGIPMEELAGARGTGAAHFAQAHLSHSDCWPKS